MTKIKNIIGHRFNKLVVVQFTRKNKHNKPFFLCKCDCGNEREVLRQELVSEQVTSCGCFKKRNYKDIKGKKFGKLEVIQFVDLNKFKNAIWLCRCDCGNLANVVSSSLLSGVTRSCGCLHLEASANQRLNYGEANFNSIFHEYKISAQKRNIEFSLSKEEFTILINKFCFYCYEKPSQVRKGASRYGDYVYNGIDRVDSSKGYVLDNCVTCCKLCNYMKKDLSIEQFKNKISKIYNYWVVNESNRQD